MNSEERNEVIHRWQNQQSMRSIALELNLSRYQVAQVIRTHQQNQDAGTQGNTNAPPASLGPAPKRRSSKLDPYTDQINQLLARYPRITATRVFEELTRSGYRGGYSILRERIRELRKTPSNN